MHTSKERLTEHETRFDASTPASTHHLPSITLNAGFPLPSFSSQDRQWVGIQVERRSLFPGVLEVPALPEHFLGLHLHQPLPVQFVQEYNGTVRQAFFREGDMTLLSSGQACLWQQEDGQAEVLQIRLQPEFLKVVAEAENVDTKYVELVDTFVFQDSWIQAIGQAFYEELCSPGIGTRLYVESQTLVLALHLLRHYGAFSYKRAETKEKLSHIKVRQALDYIHEHQEKDISLSSLADALDVSPYHLLRLFKQATGFTPHQYLLSCRVKQAQDLLMHSHFSISEIAHLTGFADQSHLTRSFKQLLNTTPAVFLRESRK